MRLVTAPELWSGFHTHLSESICALFFRKVMSVRNEEAEEQNWWESSSEERGCMV